jgi:hypothetical protein
MTNKNNSSTSIMNSNTTASTSPAVGQTIFLRVRSNGEEITRKIIERSGYRVVRYDGRYHVVRGGSNVEPYIIGDTDEDVRGIA